MAYGSIPGDVVRARTAQPEGGDLQVLTKIWARFAREEGQTMAEYAIVLGVITLATVAVFIALGGGIATTINGVIGRL